MVVAVDDAEALAICNMTMSYLILGGAAPQAPPTYNYCVEPVTAQKVTDKWAESYTRAIRQS